MSIISQSCGAASEIPAESGPPRGFGYKCTHGQCHQLAAADGRCDAALAIVAAIGIEVLGENRSRRGPARAVLFSKLYRKTTVVGRSRLTCDWLAWFAGPAVKSAMRNRGPGGADRRLYTAFDVRVAVAMVAGFLRVDFDGQPVEGLGR